MFNAADDRDLLDLYIAELRNEPVLSSEEQKELARKMLRARTDATREKARSELIRANLRLTPAERIMQADRLRAEMLQMREHARRIESR